MEASFSCEHSHLSPASSWSLLSCHTNPDRPFSVRRRTFDDRSVRLHRHVLLLLLLMGPWSNRSFGPNESARGGGARLVGWQVQGLEPLRAIRILNPSTFSRPFSETSSSSSSSFGRKTDQIHQDNDEVHYHIDNDEQEEEDTDDENDVQELYFSQRLDHFRPREVAAEDTDLDGHDLALSKCSLYFHQRYFYSTRYVHLEEAAAAGGAQEEEKKESPARGEATPDPVVETVGSSRQGSSSSTRRLRPTGQEMMMTTTAKRSTGATRSSSSSAAAAESPGVVGRAPRDETIRRRIGFLCVGGEGPPLDRSVLINSVHCTGDMLRTAQKLTSSSSNHSDSVVSIHLFALEHRYYGKSFPSTNCSNTSTGNDSDNGDDDDDHHDDNGSLILLPFLSSRQALQDLATFVTAMTAQHDLTEWIVFGASYPGMLAAWFRAQFPHLVNAAVSHSAPVQVVLDFVSYKAHESKVLADPVVGGSTACQQIVREGHAQLVQAVQDPSQQAALTQEFNLCPGPDGTGGLSEMANVRMWLGDGVIDLGTQSNDPSCEEPLCNIAKICQALLEAAGAAVTTTETSDHPSSPLSSLRLHSNNNARQALAQVALRQRQGEPCLYLNWTATLEELKQDPGEVSWLWQTCTEFGFYQTCPITAPSCPYGQGYHPLSVDLELCQYLFGRSAEQVRQTVFDTWQTYGGWKLRHTASHILSINGDVDPWSELALHPTASYGRQTDANMMPVHMVRGASHHFWTHPEQETDSLPVRQARDLVTQTVAEWLGLAYYEKDAAETEVA